ncbi:hypothetical protein BST85_03210 [Aureitalea marina]|uniref:Uncharacterized protein n=1 Tax=Aureitalea marina TaxID=930804 RepID=A0A2S7KN11_9FLAO|nr:hypothetical protein BST85_03210 [Aureitalea marina]
MSDRDTSGRNGPVNSLGILVDESIYGDPDEFYELGRRLGIQRKDMRVFVFSSDKHNLPTLRHNQLNMKEFSWSGEIRNQDAVEFLDKPFGLLLGLYKGPHLFLDMLVSRSRARFKVGLSGSDERLFDLLIGLPSWNPLAFQDELTKYLKTLNKIE